MTHSMIVWNVAASHVDFVLIPDEELSDEDRKVLSLAHGHYLDGSVPLDETPVLVGEAPSPEVVAAVAHIRDALLSIDESTDDPWAGRWMRFKRKLTWPLVDMHLTHVYLSGVEA